MSLPASWTDKIFAKLSLVYGRDFIARWDGLSIADVKTDWGHELGGFADQPEAIAYALANLPQRAPTVIEFRAICRQSPRKDAPRLEAPKADPARVAAELAKLADLRRPAADGGAGHKDWAHRLIARHEAGERLNRTVLLFARQALGLAK